MPLQRVWEKQKDTTMKTTYSIEIGPALEAAKKDEEICIRICSVKLNIPVRSDGKVALFGDAHTMADALSAIEGFLTEKEA